MIVDDIEDVCNYFKMVLEHEKYIDVVGTAYSGIEAYESIDMYKPDIVLMDIQMETEYAGLYYMEKIKEKHPNIKFIVLTMFDDDDILFKAINSGATDYILKSSSIVQIISSIKNIADNTFTLTPEMTKKFTNKISDLYSEKDSLLKVVKIISKLTSSEIDILYKIHLGKSYNSIAQERFVEVQTIRVQASKILKKFQQPSMNALISDLQKIGFFEIYNEIND